MSIDGISAMPIADCLDDNDVVFIEVNDQIYARHIQACLDNDGGLNMSFCMDMGKQISGCVRP